MFTIEYVCTGNNGRSPMAEAIGRDYVARLGLDDKISVTSSGSGVHPLFQKHGDKLRTQNLSIINLGLNNGVFAGRIKECAERILEQPEKADQRSIDQCVAYLVRAEAIFRDAALLEIGLQATYCYHKPTTPSETVNLILPMTHGNKDQVLMIYNGTSFEPLIVALNEYAGLQGDISNPFCQLLPAYHQTRDHFSKAVPKTIDRAMAELLS